MDNNIIKVSSLTKDYGSGRGVFDVSFEVRKGEVFGFLGPNGAGKTTTIRHIMGFSRPQSGETTVFGKDSFAYHNDIMKNLGYLPGEIALPEGLTGWEFIRMMQKLKKSVNEERLKYLLDKFELDPAGSTKRMSIGVKRKLAVVTAFMDDPDVLVLDEPAAGLDPRGRREMLALVRDYHARGGVTVIMVSHSMDDVARMCSRIIVMNHGKVAFDAPPAQVFAHGDELAAMGLAIDTLTPEQQAYLAGWEA